MFEISLSRNGSKSVIDKRAFERLNKQYKSLPKTLRRRVLIVISRRDDNPFTITNTKRYKDVVFWDIDIITRTFENDSSKFLYNGPYQF